MRAAAFLPWDTDLFGCRIARLDGDHASEADLLDALASCKAQEIACAYCAVPAEHTEAVRALENSGFHLVNQRITLDRLVGAELEGYGVVREAVVADVPALEAIAAVSHTDSRFYADPRFSRESCAQLYRVWIAKSCGGYAKAVLTEGAPGEPAGYITCEAGPEGTGRIGLIGVGAAHQGAGLGKRLVAGALRWFKGHGYPRVTVATQGRNVRAQRLYQGLGFKTCSVELWYHKWFSSQEHPR